jgi:hypothetical protein
MKQTLYSLRIDLPRLQGKLSRKAGYEVPFDDVFGWLSDAGFTLARGARWVANAPAVQKLELDEILECETLS